ncbi:MAG: arsenite methyltransferase [Anaerolineae bacterium]|nr:arsenite methyltransferase [Anaerolineae bacterium]
MNERTETSTHQVVQRYYGTIAISGASSCCGSPAPTDYSQRIGYSPDVLEVLPDGADLGLGCGNPTAFALLKAGETVLDLGSGAGMDVFIAASQVGKNGRVIGVDMTQDMIDRANRNAAKGDFSQVEFRLGLIEDLPVDDDSIDVVISNCVVNLSPDKAQVYQEAFRVLKPGGRLSISDPVRVGEIPPEVLEREDAYCSCIAGAASMAEIHGWLQDAGFAQIRITPKGASDAVINEWNAGVNAGFTPAQAVVSMVIEAVKPVAESSAVIPQMQQE